MIWEITSKKTGHSEIIDKDTYDYLLMNNQLKKYSVKEIKESKNPIPIEIIQKTKPERNIKSEKIND